MARLKRTPTRATTGARTETRASIGSGIGAGVLAAVVMGLVAMVVAAARGAGFWMPMELIGATYLGADFTATPFWAAILGIATHLVVGGAFGAVYSLITARVGSTSASLAVGLLYATAIFLFMTFLVMPWVNPVMYGAVDKGLFFLYHLVFGFTLGLLPARRAVTVTRRREAY